MTTYTAADIAATVVPDMGGFFTDLDARIRSWDPPEIIIRPEVEQPAGGGGGGDDGPLGALGLVAAGAALGVIVGKAISDAIEIEGVQAKLAVQLGGSPEYAAEMGAIAGDLYAGAYGDSLEGVNDALRAVLQSGAVAEDAAAPVIESVTAKVLDLSQAFGVDATEAANGLGQIMRTGLAPDAETALDIITRGYQQGADKAGDFMEVVNEYATQFRKLGIDFGTSVGLITQGLAAGARDGDVVADALKEFSIRSVDGSEAASAAYATLGLDAEKLTAQIARGGPEASAGLQIVLDRLRAMEDPVARNAAAVGLFGTQAEDLGDALFALDPSTAVAGLGDVAGAADRMDQALGETATARIESFRRSLETGLVEVIGNRVLPALQWLLDLGSNLFGPAWAPVKDVLGFIVTVGGTAAIGIGLIAGATWAWTAATTALGGALAWVSANPITAIIVGVVALAAGLIWAYQNVEWFRVAVDTAFSFVAGVAVWVWENGLRPLVDGAVAGWNAIAAGATWLWETVLSPVFSFIGTAAAVLMAVIGTVLIAPFLIAWHILSSVITWAWENVYSPVFHMIGDAASWLWTSVLMPVFGAIGVGWGMLGSGISAGYEAWILPIFNAMGAAGRWLWDNVLAPVFRLIGDGWGRMGSGLSSVYQSVIAPVWDWIMGGVRAVGDAFGWAVDRIRDVWGRIQGIVRPPVDFVVNIVYNNGIRPAWNFIAGLFGLGQLPEYRFARGGLVPGEDRGYDYVHAVLRGGEGVLVPGAVEMIGGPAGLDELNRKAEGRATGRAATGAGDWGYLGDWRGGRQHFAEGGIVGWLWDTVGSIGEFIGGVGDFMADPAGAVRRVFADLETGRLGGVGQLSAALLRMPEKAVTGAIDYVADLIHDNVGDAGAGPARGLAFARSQAGKPYQWGGGGNPSYDCSGFMASIWNVIQGKRPGRIGTTATMPWPGWREGSNPIFTVGNSRNTGSGIGHMAGTLLGVNVESAGGGAGVRVGPGARGAGSSMFTQRFTPFDSGVGILPEGFSTVYNGTGAPEPLVNPDRFDRLLDGASGGSHVELHAREPLSRAELGILADEIVRRQEWAKRRK